MFCYLLYLCYNIRKLLYNYKYIKSASHYYPFGMEMPGRSYSSNSYRFGFNGKEKDDNITGVTGSHLDFGARIYDSRIGRWLTVDPMRAIFPEMTPYNFGANNPILFIDNDGEIFRIHYEEKDASTGKTVSRTFDFNGTNQASMPSNQYVKDVVASIDYIITEGADVGGTLENLSKRSEVTDVIKQKGRQSPEYDNKSTIFYNPRVASDNNVDISYLKSESAKQSPSVGFLHEGAHRKQHLDNPTQYDIDKETDDPDYDDKEEKRVIETIQNPAIDILNKNGSKDKKANTHTGAGYYAKSPKSVDKISKKEYKKDTNDYKAKK